MIQFRSGFMFLVLMLLLLTATACKEGFTNDGGDNPGGENGPLYTVSGLLVDDGYKNYGDIHSNYRFARMGIYNIGGEKEAEIQADYFGRFSLSLSEGTYFLYISEMGSHMDVPFPLAMRVLPGGKINSSGFSLLMNVEFDNPAYVIASKSECGAEVSEYNKFYQYAYMNNRVAMETVYEGATSSSASLDERNTYDYSTEGNLISHTYDSSSGTSNDYYCEFIYEDGRLISKKKYEEVLTPDPVSLYYTITYDYDANGKVESSSFDRTDGTTYDKYF
ncbi:MAG: hypothetical protein GY754_07195, partial [bacterium]|nr:hypothetical protein [bacterium]